jgi:NH3-dependent NAD+ synthetase
VHVKFFIHFLHVFIHRSGPVRTQHLQALVPHAQVACQLHVVHIDERVASRKPEKQSEEYFSQIQSILRSLEALFPTVHVRALEDGMVEQSSTQDRKDACRRTLESAKDATSRENVLHSMRMRLLLAEARALQCNKLLVGDSATTIAARFISMTAQVRTRQ